MRQHLVNAVADGLALFRARHRHGFEQNFIDASVATNGFGRLRRRRIKAGLLRQFLNTRLFFGTQKADLAVLLGVVQRQVVVVQVELLPNFPHQRQHLRVGLPKAHGRRGEPLSHHDFERGHAAAVAGIHRDDGHA